VVNLLRWLSKKHGKTVIVVTHDENIARQTDRVIRLRDGHVTADQVIADQVIANQTAQETQHAE
jgi:ABC-type lipoprotein export system ATPase subunit